jgi:hypothetical protein
MAEQIKEPIYVVTSKTSRNVVPECMIWRGRTYQFLHLGLHHTTFDGDTLIHIFSMCTKEASFQISLNTKTLLWTLVAIEPI